MFRTLLGVVLVSALALPAAAQEQLKVGIIGLDTSHAIAFTKELNNDRAEPDVAGCPVIAVYPKGSPDIESSVSRVPDYTVQIEKLGVQVVDSIDELLKRVDCVLLETNDGRPHLEQALPVFKSGKPVFIDKPVAGSLADAIAIYKAAAKYNCPMFSSSSLRYANGTQELRSGALGKILGCDAFSPCSLEPTHPDLYWYGIHGCETLFTIMGPGCESVTRVSTPEFDVAVGKWSDGRIGTFRGIRSKGGSGYGGTAFGEKGTREIGPGGGYRPLIVEIVKFFKTKQSPIDPAETLNLYAFMEAADESKRKGGAPAAIADVMKKAEAEAEKKLAALGVK